MLAPFATPSHDFSVNAYLNKFQAFTLTKTKKNTFLLNRTQFQGRVFFILIQIKELNLLQVHYFEIKNFVLEGWAGWNYRGCTHNLLYGLANGNTTVGNKFSQTRPLVFMRYCDFFNRFPLNLNNLYIAKFKQNKFQDKPPRIFYSLRFIL
mgnify:CR=1 FL=1